MIPVQLTLACATLLLCAQAPAQAQNIEAGLQLAERWCNACHMVTAHNSWDDAEIAPRFRALTKTDANRLKTLFASGHAQMPALAQLTDSERADLAAYMQSLPPDPVAPTAQ